MPAFPSIEWFEALRRAANDTGSLRALGSCDAKVGAKAGDRAFLITFEGFECARVEQIDDDSLRDADFYLEMPSEKWKGLLRNIRGNGSADAEHSFNRLDLSLPGGIVRSWDEYRRNSFLRYHLSIQAFFDASAAFETTFE